MNKDYPILLESLVNANPAIAGNNDVMIVWITDSAQK
jgi:hypothetical protein